MNMYDLIVAKSVMDGMDRAAGRADRIRDAAPDMLEALEWLRDNREFGNICPDHIWGVIVKAIAKARGQ